MKARSAYQLLAPSSLRARAGRPDTRPGDPLFPPRRIREPLERATLSLSNSNPLITKQFGA